jgi:hypothetical protein
MPLWSGVVKTLSVSHAASVSKGTNTITVTVTEGITPIQGVTVCLSKDEDDYEVGTTNASGQVSLSFRAESAGAIKVVATGLNYKRYEGSITVGGTGAYCRVSSMTIDDDGAGGTIGNGNGIIEAGETVDFALTIQNTGTVATSGTLSVRFRSPTPGVTVIDSLANISGNIAAGGTVVATAGPRIAFASSLADEEVASFVAHIRVNTTHTWRDSFKKEVHRPELALANLRIDDTVTGNGNGIVDAGEQFKLFYRVKNFGTGTYPTGNATVTDVRWDGASKVRTRDKDGTELVLRYVTTTRELRKNVQAVVEQQWAAVGIGVELRNFTGDIFFGGYAAGGPMSIGDYDIGEYSNAPGFPDPELSNYFLCSEITSADNPDGGNNQGYCNADLDALLTEQSSTVDLNKRIDLYHQIQKILYDDVVLVMMWSDPDLWSSNNRLRGVKFSGATPFWNSNEWFVAP